jgi:hypothetical protein
LKEIRANATTDMKPSRKLALAFTALADPEYARSMVQEHAARKDKAQSTLLQLGTSVTGMRKEGMKQAMMADRATKAQISAMEKQREADQARYDLATKKLTWQNKSALIQKRAQELDENFVATRAVPPTNLDDDQAYHDYMMQTQKDLTFGRKAKAGIEMWEQYSAARPDVDPDAAEDSFRTLMLANQVSPEETEQMLEMYGPRIRSLAKLAGREVARVEAEWKTKLDVMRSNLRLNEGKVQQLAQAIKENNFKEIQRLSDEVTDMGNEYREIQESISALEIAGQNINTRYEEARAGYGDMDDATYFALSEENQRRRTEMQEHLARTEVLLRQSQRMLGQYKDRLNFEQTYNEVVDETVAEYQEKHALSSVARDPEQIIHLPQFQRELNSALKLIYPGMGTIDIADSIDREKVQRAVEQATAVKMQEAELLAGEAPLIETGQGDTGMAKKAVESVVPGQQFEGGAQRRQRLNQEED